MRFSRLLMVCLVLGLLFSLVAGAEEAESVWSSDLVDPERLPDPALMLDTGDEGSVVSLTGLGQGPYVVVPIFTRCRAVCSLVAKSLKSAWGEGGPEGAVAQIVLVSFDPKDTRADMAHFRDLFDLPRSWHMATIEREEGLRFFASLGFRWRTLAKRQFDHSGKIFVITDELRIASVLGPDQLTPERLGAEVIAARTGASLARRVGTHWLGFFGVGSILLLLLAVVTWDKMRSRRRPVAKAGSL
jgi:cytochrome oxidase Cu insertion factor (SCO1/SenC/PrrC family)